MSRVSPQPWAKVAWFLVKQQHGVTTHAQLRELGVGPEAIQHRLHNGRLHPLMRGIYAVGRPEVGKRGRWQAAVLACGPDALLSHRSAGALWKIHRYDGELLEVVVPKEGPRRRPGIRAHRRGNHEAPSRRVVDNIPVTHPVATLVDLATCLPTGQLEVAVNEADHRNLVDPEQLSTALDLLPRRVGLVRLRKLLDTPTLALSSTELERRLLPLADEVGLPTPFTQAWVDGHRVDFSWPELNLVVEADSLRYHRTASKQAKDKRRDNAHAEA